ncbi:MULTISPECIES: hypothetical protein [Streptosporangium]|uniref:Uncharacterized protein n=1 Tax=Streptosporangium brasiliense TaxID=47480 RepID=A0ABT9RLI8_9ACTN|nr:hypothetical protein [Streptosporangium brasiliense]MDP9869599.1 hypothetical protein [Streptosporangium brasiliense]
MCRLTAADETPTTAATAFLLLLTGLWATPGPAPASPARPVLTSR